MSQNNTFSIPPISVFKVGISISKLDNKKSTGCDGISVKLLKIALPYIAETLTYIYKLCIQKNVFPTAFKKAKVIPLPKTKPVSTDLNGRGGGGGGHGGGRGRLYTYRYTVTTRMTSALRWAAMRAILMFHNCEGQSHKKEEPKQIRTEVPLLTSLMPYR